MNNKKKIDKQHEYFKILLHKSFFFIVAPTEGEIYCEIKIKFGGRYLTSRLSKKVCASINFTLLYEQ